jgi:transposase
LAPTNHGEAVKIMVIVDRHGMPLAVSTNAANHHEVTLVQLCFEFYIIEAKPENLIGDKAYDSDQLDENLRQEGLLSFPVSQVAGAASERRSFAPRRAP